MAKNQFRVFDSDLHVFEPPELYQRYIEERFRNRAPYAVSDRDVNTRGLRWVVDDYQFPRQIGGSRPDVEEHVRKVLAPYAAKGFDSVSQLAAMDVEGVDVAVLFRTMPLIAIDALDPEFAIALCQAWNDWITEFRQVDINRLQTVALLSLHDTDLAVLELRRAVNKLGMVGAQLLPNPVNGRHINDPIFQPLWATAEEMDVAICFHPGPNNYSVDHFTNRFLEQQGVILTHCLNNPVELMAAIGSMTVGGVLQQFPGLRVGFLEGNCTWVPWFLWRLDEQWEMSRSGESVQLETRPSEYFLRQSFVNVEPDEHFVEWVIGQIGDSNLVFSTDYPHSDSKFPYATSTLLELNLEESSKQKILWDNCCRLYGL